MVYLQKRQDTLKMKQENADSLTNNRTEVTSDALNRKRSHIMSSLQNEEKCGKCRRIYSDKI